MPGFEVFEKLPRWTEPPLFGVLQALTDTLLRIGARGDVEEVLVGFGVLHNSRRFSFHRQHYGAFGLFEPFHEVAGSAAERCQRMDVIRNIEHGTAPIHLLKHLFKRHYQAFGIRAKQSVSQLTFGREVKIVLRDTDRYGRGVGEVIPSIRVHPWPSHAREIEIIPLLSTP